jgi:hypothetical protein
MSYKIFVEGVSDQKFCQAIAYKIGLTISDEYFYPQSIDKEGNNLKKFIVNHFEAVENGQIDTLGIIIDLDDFTVQERLNYINDAIKRAFQEEYSIDINLVIGAENTTYFIDFQGNTLSFICYFMKVANRGHLDTVLKEIANKSSGYADCLTTWQTCVEGKKLQYDQNQYEKFWVNTYINLDTCTSSKHKGNKEKYCSMKNFDELIKKDIFNLEHECLNDLKIFLKMF